MTVVDPSKNILVVDDEAVVLSLFQKVFKNSEHRFVTLSSGAEAHNRLDSEKYDLIIADICMPEIDGLSLAQKAMKINPNTKVIIMTGFGTNDRLLKCIEMDCYGYVDKPFNWDYMKALISKALA